MNCHALSLTGEREILATAIYIIKQTLVDGVHETTLQNIYDIFLESSNLLSTAEGFATSPHPASASAIAAFLTSELVPYRRIDTPIQMSEVENLFSFLNNYRLLTNQTFSNLVCDTLNYHESGQATNLATRIQGLDSRLTLDETELHALAAGLAGSDIMSSESSLTDWVQTHARDFFFFYG